MLHQLVFGKLPKRVSRSRREFVLKLYINLYKINTEMNKVKKYKSITRQISFPQKLMDRVESRAQSLGYSLPAYVRYVLTKEMEEKAYPNLDGVMIDEEMARSLQKGVDDFKSGQTVELKNNKEIKNFIEGLLNGEK